MTITKTKFINYVRCPRYCTFDTITNNNISIEDYRKEDSFSELITDLDPEIGLIDNNNPHLEALLPYYNQVEILAGDMVKELFPGKTIYSKETLNQESFKAKLNNINFLCYVDIINIEDDKLSIIEVKATTSNKFLKLSYKQERQDYGIFQKNNLGIYELTGTNTKGYFNQLAKLMDKYHECGKYVYDLAVQAFIIEEDLKQNGGINMLDKVNYYLAVLNHEYVFDGTYKQGKPVYNTDKFGNELITLFNLTDLVKSMLDKIKLDKDRVVEYVTNLDTTPVPVGKWCELKKNTVCLYQPVCFKKMPKLNNIMSYIGYHHGFKDPEGTKHNHFDLINEGIVNMLDIPDMWLTRAKNIIQRNCVEENIEYENVDKIKAALDQLSYPIYHLDFETFPCPLPRFKGEKAYSQSLFQYSLHIEKAPGVVDFDKDHYEFLAPDHEDHREALIKHLINNIDLTKPGTILVYNESFERSRLKEMAIIFPKYKKELDTMIDMLFDLLYIVKTNTKLYESLGFTSEESKLFNYYHPELNGSFSIKKVLPCFSDLSYSELNVQDGTDAMITYARFPLMEKDEYQRELQNLLDYCKQDTWAEVAILSGLRSIIDTRKKVSN